MVPGELLTDGPDIVINPGRRTLTMVVENAGFGAQIAAPIARRVFDYILLGLYPSQEDLDAVRIGQATRPVGKRRPASTVPWPPKPATIPAEPSLDEENEP